MFKLLLNCSLVKTSEGSFTLDQRFPYKESEEREPLVPGPQTFARSSCRLLFRFGAPGFGFGTSDPG